MKETSDGKFEFNQARMYIPKELSDRKTALQDPTTIQLGFVARCHYVSIRNINPGPEEETVEFQDKIQKKLVLPNAAKIEGSFSKEFIEQFIESQGRENLKFRQDGGLDWRSAKPLFRNYIKTLEEVSGSNTDLNATCENGKERKESTIMPANLEKPRIEMQQSSECIDSKTESSLGEKAVSLKRKALSNEIYNVTKGMKLNYREENMKDPPVEISTNTFIDSDTLGNDFSKRIT